jgi:CDP-paratose 2-epimerase
MLEAIALCEDIAGSQLRWTLDERSRLGDHRWWISDLRPFQHDYPYWTIKYDLRATLEEIYEQHQERWTEGALR